MASRFATASPMPEPAPVTKAIFPEKSCNVGTPVWGNRPGASGYAANCALPSLPAGLCRQDLSIGFQVAALEPALEPVECT